MDKLKKFSKEQIKVSEACMDYIITKAADEWPYVTGITGIDCSGKTEFTKILGEYLVDSGYEVSIIHLDDFHNPANIRRQGKDPVKGYYENAFDLKKIVDEVLFPLKKNGKLELELDVLNLETDKYDKKIHYNIPSHHLVLFEGVFLFREELRNYSDSFIFLDIDFETCIERALKRDEYLFSSEIKERYNTRYIPAQKEYLKNYPPEEHASIIIDNNFFRQPEIRKNIL